MPDKRIHHAERTTANVHVFLIDYIERDCDLCIGQLVAKLWFNNMKKGETENRLVQCK